MKWATIYVVAGLFVQTFGRTLIEVDPDENGGKLPPLDLTGSGLTTTYCAVEGYECPAPDLDFTKFAPTVRQCLARCSRELKCVTAFYKNKTCYMRGKRCDADELIASDGGIDLFRLQTGEKCPSNRPEWKDIPIHYSNRFCLYQGKACKGHNLYDKPQNIYPMEECLKKCAKITSCTGVDFYGRKCEPKDYQCADEELVDEPGTGNYMRLEESQLECPSNREVPTPEPTTPEPPTTTTEIPPTTEQVTTTEETNLVTPFGTLVPPIRLECPENSSRQRNYGSLREQCRCNSGYHWSNENCAQDCQNDGPREVALMTVGTLVKRGCDWVWSNQDFSGIGRISHPINSWASSVGPGWIGVTWENGALHRYRMGADGKYELKLAETKTPTGILVPPVKKDCIKRGPQYAYYMVIGMRVKRGCDWMYGDQDGPTGLGRISDPINSWSWTLGPGWIGVKWDTGNVNRYRMGAEGKYDLELA